MPQTVARLRVLVIEDNPADAMLIRMALDHAGLRFDLEIIEDGDSAVERLCRTSDDGNGIDLIILDLNLPRRHGTEVLQAVRGGECTVSAPVVVLSSSPEDVIEQAVQQANVHVECFLTKPPSLDDFIALGSVIRRCYEDSVRQRSM